jgi:hypothetical protein|nr:MAG TPA: hypothetical protein [Caudoviricetes sp.]
MAIRCRMNGHCIEMWLGPPDDPESDLIACFDKAYLPEVQSQLNQMHKWPKLHQYDGKVRPVKRNPHV